MQHVKIRENVNLKDKRRSLTLYLLLALITVAVFALSYWMTAST